MLTLKANPAGSPRTPTVPPANPPLPRPAVREASAAVNDVAAVAKLVC